MLAVGRRRRRLWPAGLPIAPDVGQELGEFSLFGRDANDVRSEIPEQLLRPIAGRIVVRPNYLRQAGQLLQRVSLGDTLRAECDLYVARSGLKAPARYSLVPG